MECRHSQRLHLEFHLCLLWTCCKNKRDWKAMVSFGMVDVRSRKAERGTNLDFEGMDPKFMSCLIEMLLGTLCVDLLTWLLKILTKHSGGSDHCSTSNLLQFF
uniref:Uncharacterized protein n=1 Tax=Physcomitrium patens TaxID=3218 RepID=A0A7I4ALE1_PHYPA